MRKVGGTAVSAVNTCDLYTADTAVPPIVINAVAHVDVVEVEELAESQRGRGGFGHTGH